MTREELLLQLNMLAHRLTTLYNLVQQEGLDERVPPPEPTPKTCAYCANWQPNFRSEKG